MSEASGRPVTRIPIPAELGRALDAACRSQGTTPDRLLVDFLPTIRGARILEDGTGYLAVDATRPAPTAAQLNDAFLAIGLWTVAPAGVWSWLSSLAEAARIAADTADLAATDVADAAQALHDAAASPGNRRTWSLVAGFLAVGLGAYLVYRLSR